MHDSAGTFRSRPKRLVCVLGQPLEPERNRSPIPSPNGVNDGIIHARYFSIYRRIMDVIRWHWRHSTFGMNFAARVNAADRQSVNVMMPEQPTNWMSPVASHCFITHSFQLTSRTLHICSINFIVFERNDRWLASWLLGREPCTKFVFRACIRQQLGATK